MESVAMTNAIAQDLAQIAINLSLKPTLSDISVKDMMQVVMVLMMSAKTILCFISISILSVFFQQCGQD
jgi:hypothetical protein